MSQEAIALYVVLLTLAILLSAFFSASEAAFLSAQRVKVRQMVSAGVAGARRMSRYVEHPERLLPTVLLGNNLVNTAAAALGTIIALAFLGKGPGVLVATIGVATLLIVFGESLPKTLAARHPERLALVFALPILWIERILFPLTAPLQRLNRWVASTLGGVSTRTLVTEEEIKVLISLGREVGVVEEAEAEMLYRVLRFTDRQVQEMMTPRTEMVWIDRKMPLSQFLEFNALHYHSRFPVGDGDADNIVGVLAAKDVLRAMAKGELQPADPVAKLMQSPYFVPDTKRMGDLMAEMRQHGVNMAIVTDEFGGVAGLVTFKELVEEIVGRVQEEGAREEFRAIDEHSFQVDGGMRVDAANDKLGLGLPDGDYETVAGFVLKELGHIPKRGERLSYGNLQLTVAEMRGVKVEKVTVVRRAQPARTEG